VPERKILVFVRVLINHWELLTILNMTQIEKNNNILLVDKDKELCNALGKYLDRYGYNITKAESSRNALSFISKNRPSIVISGTQLQDVDGVDFLGKVKCNFPEMSS